VTDCEYCLDADADRGDYCDAEDPQSRLICTRREGHDGPHVACTPMFASHEVAVWGDDLEEVVEA